MPAKRKHGGSGSDDDGSGSDDDTGSLPLCKYGAGCYRKNPEHFKEFRHPKPAKPAAAVAVAKKPKPSPAPVPPPPVAAAKPKPKPAAPAPAAAPAPKKPPPPPAAAAVDDDSDSGAGGGGGASGSLDPAIDPAWLAASKKRIEAVAALLRPAAPPSAAAAAAKPIDAAPPPYEDTADTASAAIARRASSGAAAAAAAAAKPAAAAGGGGGWSIAPVLDTQPSLPPPSYEQSTESLDTSAAAGDSGAPKPVCPYGVRCYRKNLMHFAEYSHPTKDDGKPPVKSGAAAASTAPPAAAAAAAATSSVPARRSPVFSPAAAPAPASGPKWGIAAVEDGDDDVSITDIKSSAPASASASSSSASSAASSSSSSASNGSGAAPAAAAAPRPTAPTLFRSYSSLSENERKELIADALREQQKLQQLLKSQKEAAEKREREMEDLKTQLAASAAAVAAGGTASALVKGEKEALEGGEVKYFPLYPERTHDGTAEQMHFRLAESQFYRLLDSSTNYRVSKVEYVVSPALVHAFNAAKTELEERARKENVPDSAAASSSSSSSSSKSKKKLVVEAAPVLGFHGTDSKNIKPICETGFRVPGKDGHKHATDTGWYGKGVYFSEYPAYAMDYIRGATQLMLCQILLGKVYHCTKLIHGASLQPGFDSHMSPDGKEVVVFDNAHVLPCYIVHYANKKGDFKYAAKPAAAGGGGGAASGGDKKDMKQPSGRRPDDLYTEALGLDDSKALKGMKFTLSGKLVAAHPTLKQLISQHAGTVCTAPSVTGCTALIATDTDYIKRAAKVETAEELGVPIVTQSYLFDMILTNGCVSIDDYLCANVV